MSKPDLTKPVTVELLTLREQEVLAYMAEGLSNSEIASRMVVALSTVKWYARQLFNKLGVSSRQEAVERAWNTGLLSTGFETAPATGNLPQPISSFVGRERETAQLKQLLKNARLVTLTGTGGSGKTRLALRTAALAAPDFPDGVFYISLASITDAERVANAIAGVLGVFEQPDASLIETLQLYLARRRSLLLLDSFEHLLPSAPLLTELLASAPWLVILVTSREPLHLSGEYEYLVPPLTLPDPAAAAAPSAYLAAESVALFVQRAGMARYGFSLADENAAAVAALCSRLDGLPLAIELAAARIKLFSPAQILERLHSRLDLLVGGARDLPDRQRTLRGTIDWSYDLLPAEEKTLFARLAVFNGGRTIETVEAVCGSGDEDATLSGLESLVNKNLLYQKEGPTGEPRFYMLETIHEYARERLRAAGEEPLLQDRHLAAFIDLCEAMAPGYYGENQLTLFRRTAAEIGNIRKAFEWAFNSGQFELAARLITAVNYYMRYAKESVVEGYRLARRLLPHVETITLCYRVPFLIGAAELAFQTSDRDHHRQLSQQALNLARELGDRRLLAWALVLNVDFTTPGKDYDRAVSAGKEALVIFRELDDQPGIAYTLNRLGEVYRLHGDHRRAQAAYEESQALCIKTGELIRENFMYGGLGLVAYDEGEYERAKAYFLFALARRELLDWTHWTISVLSELAGPLARLGEPQKAARILGACHALKNELGIAYHPNDQAAIAQIETDVRSYLDKAAFAREWEEGRRMSFDETIRYALDDA